MISASSSSVSSGCHPSTSCAWPPGAPLVTYRRQRQRDSTIRKVERGALGELGHRHLAAPLRRVLRPSDLHDQIGAVVVGTEVVPVRVDANGDRLQRLIVVGV